MWFTRVAVPVLSAARLTALAAVVAFVGAAGGASPAGAGAAAQQQFAFVSASRLELVVVDADGPARKRLTSCQDASVCRIGEFAWSPRGARIAFYRGVWHRSMWLYVINADGSGLRRLAYCGVWCSRPSWASDGSALTFARGGSIFVVATRTAQVRRLTRCAPPACVDAWPVWSPTGRQIAFTRGANMSRTSLYVVDPAAASKPRQLASLLVRASNLAWSPDGRRVAFDGSDGASESVYVMRADGSRATAVASGANGSGPGMPSWSPDGTSIAYFNTPRAANGFFEPEVWTVQRDGTAPRRLFHADCCVFTWVPPSWSADGTELAFAYSGNLGTPTGERTGGTFLLRTDGSAVRRLDEAVSELAARPRRR